MKKLLIPLVMFSVAIFITLAICEVLLHLFMPLERKRERYQDCRNVFQYVRSNILFDSELGYTNRPNNLVTFSNKEFTTKVRINHMGFRDDPESLDNPDIFVLGDSFAFGWGVNENETMASVLEKEINAKVLNMGVSGYQTIQELLLLKRFTKNKNVTGKTAVFLFFENDLYESIYRSYKHIPTIGFDGAQFSIALPDKEDFERWFQLSNRFIMHGISKRLYTIYLARKFYLKTYVLPRMTSERQKNDPLYIIPKVPDSFRWIASHIKAYSTSKKLNPLIVFIPFNKYYERPSNYLHVLKLLSDILKELQVPSIDLSPVLSRDDYYLYDGHWKASGHKKAANTIGEYIKTWNK